MLCLYQSGSVFHLFPNNPPKRTLKILVVDSLLECLVDKSLIPKTTKAAYAAPKLMKPLAYLR
jgi:hypothetical protein